MLLLSQVFKETLGKPEMIYCNFKKGIASSRWA